MLRRRLTALLASLLLLPSMIVGGGEGCIMGTVGSIGADAATADAASAHNHGEHPHSPGHGDALVYNSDTSSPVGVPHAPAQCILVGGCGAAVVTAAVIAIEVPPHNVRRVDTVVALAPDSPALGIEPPPPRA